jgi:hypothetical protein
MDARRIASWRAIAAAVASGAASHRFVEPSTSVKREATVPVGCSMADMDIGDPLVVLHPNTKVCDRVGREAIRTAH